MQIIGCKVTKKIALLILLIYQVHHNLHHYILFLSAALCNHQSKCNEGVVGNAFVSVLAIELLQ